MTCPYCEYELRLRYLPSDEESAKRIAMNEEFLSYLKRLSEDQDRLVRDGEMGARIMKDAIK